MYARSTAVNAQNTVHRRRRRRKRRATGLSPRRRSLSAWLTSVAKNQVERRWCSFSCSIMNLRWRGRVMRSEKSVNEKAYIKRVTKALSGRRVCIATAAFVGIIIPRSAASGVCYGIEVAFSKAFSRSGSIRSSR